MGITTSCFHHLKEVEKKKSGECSIGDVEEVEKKESGEWSIGGVEDMEKKESGECSIRGVEEVEKKESEEWSIGGVEDMEKKESGECSIGGVEEVEKKESGECCGGGVEKHIERSKSHWSILDVVEGEEVAEVSNVEEFLALQSHPVCGGFFQTFGYDLGERYKRLGELVMGDKFAEGAQAELYDCKVKWWYPEKNDEDLKDGREYVLKVFKKGTYLKHLKSLLPQGLLQHRVRHVKNLESPTPIKVPKFVCNVYRGTLLEDGRFAFLMEKEHFDLRHLIDENMKMRSGKDCGPFSQMEVEFIMFKVALGVDWLHRNGIIHRDLKASNVLVWKFASGRPKWSIFISDYECSVGVIGTGFFRAPEILQACKERKLSERPEVFSKAADIYGFGMVWYEVLTGKLPFEGFPRNDYNHVLNGDRPLVPMHSKDWIHELLDKCWQTEPTTRPCIGDILSVILGHSSIARKVEEGLKTDYGEHYRDGFQARM